MKRKELSEMSQRAMRITYSIVKKEKKMSLRFIIMLMYTYFHKHHHRQ